MRPLLAQGLGMLMLAQLDPVIGVFKDGCQSNAPTACWDNLGATDYYNEPGWVDTVERYRKIEYDRRNIHQDAAYNDMVPIATYMFFAVPLAFVVVSLLMWYFTGKEASALHDYVISHHQDADWVDEHVSNRNSRRSICTKGVSVSASTMKRLMSLGWSTWAGWRVASVEPATCRRDRDLRATRRR